MSKRPTALDKAIQGPDHEIEAHVRDSFVAQRHQADLEVARGPKLKIVAQ